MPLVSSSRIFLALLVLLLLLVQPVVLCGDPANFSGLQGQELKQSAGLQDLARELLYRGDGKIERIRVLGDYSESLTVQITYSASESDIPLVLLVSAEDGKLHRIAAIPESSVELNAAKGEATVELKLAPNTPEGAKLDQSLLVVRIGKKGASPKDQAAKAFRCSKKWEKAISPANLKINVTAEPIGKSKTLPPDPKPVVVPAAGAVLKPVTLRPLDRAAPTKGTVTVTRTEVAKPVPTSSIAVRSASPRGPVMATLNPSLMVLKRADLVVGLPQDVKNNNGKGPSANAIRLFDALGSDIGLNAEDVTDLHPNVYEDANPASGYFYYLPRGYYLYWGEDTDYALRILYGASSDESDKNTVSVAARLTSGIDGADVALVRNLLSKYCAGTGRTFKELRPFPFSNMSVSLKGDLGQYNIAPEKISVTGISDIAGMIDISLTTDPVTKENLQMVLTEGLGINGLVTYQSASASGGGLEVSIPISIKFADRHSFGARSFARSAEFKNSSLYPMKMKYVNILMNEKTPIVYSYGLSDTQVPAGAKATIDASKIPNWVDKTAAKMWVDYAVMDKDEEATSKAIEAVTGGVTSVAQSQISFRTLSPLADTGAALVLVTVSSKYFDPKASTETVKTVELNKDSTTFNVGPVYLVNRQPGEEKPGDPLFKFKLTVVKPDGTTKEGTQWTESNSLTIYIGEAQLRPITGQEGGAP